MRSAVPRYVEDESWKDEVLSRMQATHQKKKTGPAPDPRSFRKKGYRLNVLMGIDLYKALFTASRARDVALSSYCRRAMIAMLAKDLDMPALDLAKDAPACRVFGQSYFPPGDRDDGRGMETWCSHPGCDGEHLLR